MRRVVAGTTVLVCALLFGQSTSSAQEPPTFVYTNYNDGRVSADGSNTVAAFSVDPTTGALTLVGTYPTGGVGFRGLRNALEFGSAPSHRAVVCGPWLYVSNDGDSTISGFSIAPTTGALTLLPLRTALGGASLACAPGGQFLIAAPWSSGEVDSFRIESNGALTPLGGAPVDAAEGANGITISPDGQFVAVAFERSDNIAMFRINLDGGLTHVGETLSPSPGSAAGVTIDPSGKYLYVSQSDPAGDDTSIDVFEIDSLTGALTLEQTATAIGSGASTDLVLQGEHLFVNGMVTDLVSVFTVLSDGTLSLAGTYNGFGWGVPAGIATSEGGTFLFTANDSSVSSARINADGSLEMTRNVPIDAPGIPQSLVVFTASVVDTSTSLTATPDTAKVGQTVTFTATVTAVSGNVAPAGDVQLIDSGTVVALNPLSPLSSTQSQVQFSISNFTAGSHSMQASYLGETAGALTFNSSQSTTISQVIDKVDTTTTLSSTANPSVIGQSVTLTAIVQADSSSITPTGTVRFSDGTTTLDTVMVSGGAASYSTSALAHGGHSITATYSGDTNLNGSAGSLTQSVIIASTTTTLSSSANPATFAQSVTFTATVAPLASGSATPTGTVTFTDGATTLGTASLAGTVATFTTSTLAIGSHAMSAVYGGSTTYLPSTGTLTQVVDRAPTTSTLTPSVNPSVVGQSVTLTATVAGPAEIVGGQVSRWALNEAAGAASAADSVDSNPGTCGGGCPTFGGAGTFGTVATFDGVDDYLKVNNTFSGTFTASAWIKTTQVGGIGDGNAYSGHGIIWSDIGGQARDIIPMSLVGNRLAFGTGESGAAYNTITSSAAVNTGSWVHVVVTRDSANGAKQMFINGVLDASGTGSAGQLNANGIVAFGANPLDNRYFNGSIDDIQLFNRVLTAADVHALFTNGPSPAGPAGTVTFSEGGTALGTGQLVAGAATFTTRALTLGGHTVTASYGGDSAYLDSAATLIQTVNQASSQTTIGSTGTLRYGSTNMAILVTVLPLSPASGSPTGSVTLSDGSTVIGTATLTPASNRSTASFPLPPTTPAGNHLYTATYSGDTNFTASTSQATNRPVAKAPLQVTADNKTKTYGAPLPPLTVTYSGLVNGDTEAVIDTPPTITTTATQASHVGSYTLTPSSAFDNNYSFATSAYHPGTLMVTPATLTISADDKTTGYGAGLPALTVSYSGFANGETAASLITQPTITTTATATSPAGSYPITVSGATASTDYTLTFVNGTLAVTPAALTITADNKSREFGTATPPLTASYAGFVNGDTAASLDTPVTLSTEAALTSPPGAYSITASGAADANYTIAFVNGVLYVTDTTAPVLQLPSNITTDGTSAAGASVAFAATAVDAVDGARPVSCTPASGSAFAIGDTTVSCSSTDTRGNEAAGSFSVHVNSAGEITQTLLDVSAAIGMQESSTLLSKVQQAANGGTVNPNVACNNLGAFVNQVNARRTLSPEAKNALLTGAANVGAMLGCK